MATYIALVIEMGTKTSDWANYINKNGCVDISMLGLLILLSYNVLTGVGV